MPCTTVLQASHKNAEKQLQRTSQNLADSIAAVDTLGEQLQAAGERYAFLQHTKAYISDLCDMLQVSAVHVLKLIHGCEVSMASLMLQASCSCCHH